MIVKDSISFKQIISSAQEKGEIVLVKKGVFDIIHPGHIYAIGELSKIADVVIIIIQSDEFTKKKKGKERPINSQQQRAEVIDGIKNVDYVYLGKSNSREEYVELITDLKPSILAITSTTEEKRAAYTGSDWRLVELPDKVDETYSTTNIIKRIVKKYSHT